MFLLSAFHPQRVFSDGTRGSAHLSELRRVVLELVEFGFVVVEVLPDGEDQLQVPLVEVVRHQVNAARQLGRPGRK